MKKNYLISLLLVLCVFYTGCFKNDDNAEISKKQYKELIAIEEELQSIKNKKEFFPLLGSWFLSQKESEVITEKEVNTLLKKIEEMKEDGIITKKERTYFKDFTKNVFLPPIKKRADAVEEKEFFEDKNEFLKK